MRLGTVTYLARDYDEAIQWFRNILGWVVLEDTHIGSNKRWVRVAPSPSSETAFLIAKAVGPQVDHVGQAAGNRVAYFLEVDDFDSTHKTLCDRGVRFDETPRHEPYGTVAVFRDLYDNRWDLLHLT